MCRTLFFSWWGCGESPVPPPPLILDRMKLIYFTAELASRWGCVLKIRSLLGAVMVVI